MGDELRQALSANGFQIRCDDPLRIERHGDHATGELALLLAQLCYEGEVVLREPTVEDTP